MSAAHKKQSESKYVSCFADSRPDVDITFRDVLLTRPTDHYLVGIDNFSMTNTSLSMIEPQTGVYDALIRIVRNPQAAKVDAPPTTAAELNDVLGDGANGVGIALNHLYITDNDYDLSIKSTETILSMQQLMHRLGNLAADVNLYMNTGEAMGVEYEDGGYEPQQPDGTETTEHLKFSVGTNGHIAVKGTRAFWSCFSIEVPSVRNQFGFYGPVDGGVLPYTRLRRFLSVHPETGKRTFNKIIMNRFPKTVPTERFYVYNRDGSKNYTESAVEFATRVQAALDFNKHCVGGSEPRIVRTEWALTGQADDFNQYPNDMAGEDSLRLHTINLGASVFSSLERRVALEVGCSLPIKNSPMVDHNKESPDFVLGRWIWRTDPRIESNEYGGSRRYHSNMPACTEYQGAQDRITYHELQAQAKIQTLRVRLFARLRTFDELSETWGMRVIELPTSATDWWHARLHFISKE